MIQRERVQTVVHLLYAGYRFSRGAVGDDPSFFCRFFRPFANTQLCALRINARGFPRKIPELGRRIADGSQFSARDTLAFGDDASIPLALTESHSPPNVFFINFAVSICARMEESALCV